MSGPAPSFRDPPSRKHEADALALELARTLVGAPSLPIELPRFSMRLLAARAPSASAVELVLGHEDPVAVLRITGPRRDGLVPLGKPAAVAVTLRELHASAATERPRLETMAERLARAIDEPKWARAKAIAAELRTVQSDVPIEHYRQRVEGADGVGLVRVGFLCNQDCGLCWQDRDWPRFPPEQVRIWISDLAAQGVRQLIVSGGEPTLDPELPSYLAHARAAGITSITLETNAIQCARPGLAASLAAAGLDVAFVSLHSPDAAVSDAITRAPGTHVKTIAGIHALIEAGVRVKLNCVMTAEGLGTLPALPDYLAAELGRHERRISLMLSYPSDAYDATLVPRIRPDPDALRSALRAAIDRAVALGIEIDGIDGPCGPPLCAHGADRRVVSLAPLREPISFRTFVPACDRCAVRTACPGVRPGDVEAFGDRAVVPLDAIPPG